MAIITFLKEEEKPIGKTMSTLAIATYMAMEHNVRTLVVSTDYNQKAVQRCFWEEEKPKKVNFGIFGPNTKTLDSENGMKGLEKIIKSNKITPNLIIYSLISSIKIGIPFSLLFIYSNTIL